MSYSFVNAEVVSKEVLSGLEQEHATYAARRRAATSDDEIRDLTYVLEDLDQRIKNLGIDAPTREDQIAAVLDAPVKNNVFPFRRKAK